MRESERYVELALYLPGATGMHCNRSQRNGLTDCSVAYSEELISAVIWLILSWLLRWKHAHTMRFRPGHRPRRRQGYVMPQILYRWI